MVLALQNVRSVHSKGYVAFDFINEMSEELKIQPHIKKAQYLQSELNMKIQRQHYISDTWAQNRRTHGVTVQQRKDE